MFASNGARRAAAALAVVLLSVLAVPSASADEEIRSVVDWLDARGEDSGFESRRLRFAEIYPDEEYVGSAEQNLRLLGRLRVAELLAGRSVAEPAPRSRGGASFPPPPPPAARGGADASSAAVPLRVESLRGGELTLDLSPQVLRLELREPEVTVLPGRPAGTFTDLPLRAAPGGVFQLFVSASVLGWKAKRFDDGLVATVELALQERDKRPFLEHLQARLTAERVPGVGAACVVAACRLGGLSLSPWLDAEAADLVRRFEADEVRSKPLGTWARTEDLRRLFRQDRMLQTPLYAPSAAPLADAVRADQRLWAAYERLLTLNERLTAPAGALADLRAFYRGPDRPAPARVAILPPSRSFEVALAERLFGATGIPEGEDLSRRLLDEVRSGRLSLAPTEASGWYERQAWALEPLARPDAAPEAARLVLGPRYREHLGELFRGLLALARETHVKQVEIGVCGAAPPPLTIRPQLTVEPLPTHYRRRAETYAFVRELLVSHFGAEALASLHRLGEDGAVSEDLLSELRGMERLFRGAAATAERELGLRAGSARDAEDSDEFALWRANPDADPDLAGDSRMMVPLAVDPAKGTTRVWAFLGWLARDLDVSFETRPVPTSLMRDGAPAGSLPRIEWGGNCFTVSVPVVVEVDVTRLLDRDEMRALCDRWRTRSAILAHLE